MSDPLLAVSNLHAFYGQAHILHGVSFELQGEPLGLIGRNGMGKSTLCNALMGLVPKVSGGIHFRGGNLAGRQPHQIAAAGLGYVPQGRRTFPSLTTHDHLRMVAERDGRWSIDDVYALFPALAVRRRSRAAQLSGGEQQMLAIARALLTNPAVLILDEPSEGLAPRVVEALVGTVLELGEEGIGILLVEQKLGVATAIADRLLVMVNGRIAGDMSSAELLGDEDAQRRYLGVESLAASGATDESAGSDPRDRCRGVV